MYHHQVWLQIDLIEKALSLSTEVGGIHFRALNNFLNKRGMS
jgi:hypothetical protein